MLKTIEEVNILQLMKDIKNMISNRVFELNSNNYEIKLFKEGRNIDLQPLINLLNVMVKDDYLITEIYFESEADFERCCSISYDKRVNEIVHSIRIDKIKFANKDSYSGTLIYHEAYNGKLRFELDCIKYLTRSQKERLWEDGNQ